MFTRCLSRFACELSSHWPPRFPEQCGVGGDNVGNLVDPFGRLQHIFGLLVRPFRNLIHDFYGTVCHIVAEFRDSAVVLAMVVPFSIACKQSSISWVSIVRLPHSCRQIAYLIRDYGKPFAGFPCTGSFYSRMSARHVGLEGNIFNRFDNLAGFTGGRIDLIHGLHHLVMYWLELLSSCPPIPPAGWRPAPGKRSRGFGRRCPQSWKRVPARSWPVVYCPVPVPVRPRQSVRIRWSLPLQPVRAATK